MRKPGGWQGSGFVELLRALGEAKSLGEKGHRNLIGFVLPRLAAFEVLPANMVAQLLQVTASSADEKCGPLHAVLFSAPTTS